MQDQSHSSEFYEAAWLLPNDNTGKSTAVQVDGNPVNESQQ